MKKNTANINVKKGKRKLKRKQILTETLFWKKFLEKIKHILLWLHSKHSSIPVEVSTLQWYFLLVAKNVSVVVWVCVAVCLWNLSTWMTVILFSFPQWCRQEWGERWNLQQMLLSSKINTALWCMNLMNTSRLSVISLVLVWKVSEQLKKCNNLL